MAVTIMLIPAIALVTFFGWNVLLLLPRPRRGLYVPEALALSYGMGMAAVSLEMLIFYFLGLSFNIILIIAPWIALFVLNTVVIRRPAGKMISAMPKDGNGSLIWCNLLKAGIAVETAYVFFRALIKPLEAYDAVAIYAIKSKIFYVAGSIPQGFFSNMGNLFPHPDYPLNIQLAKTFVYLVMGQFNDQLIKMIFPMYFAGILCLIYCAVRRVASRLHALIFTFALATIPQFNAYATNGYLDLVLSFYIFAASLFLLAWARDRQDTFSLAVSAIMVAFAAWTKNEGLMYCVIDMSILAGLLIVGISGIRKENIIRAAGYAAVVFAISLPWLWIKHSAHLTNSDIDLAGMNPANLMKEAHRILPILYEFQKEFFNPKKWLIIWPATAIIMFLNFKRIFTGTARRFIALSIAMCILGYVAVYMVSVTPVAFLVSKTWSRFLIHFLPLVVYYAALLTAEDGCCREKK